MAGHCRTPPSLFYLIPVLFPSLYYQQAVAKSFGFSGPPKVSLNIESKAAHGRRAKRGAHQTGGGGGAGAGGADYRRFKPASGHTFSAANPYGVRAKGDNRQLARF